MPNMEALTAHGTIGPMAKYSPEQRSRNQTTVLGVSSAALVLMLLGAVAGVLPFSGVPYGFIAVAVIGGISWWLFASKHAGDVSDTWVEWNLKEKSADPLLQQHVADPLSINDDPDQGGSQRNRQPRP